jgi:ATP-dependent RNA helicase DHX33
MASFPLEPAHARAVIASKDLGCTAEVLDVVSVLAATAKLFVDATDKRMEIAAARRMLVHPAGDHLTILNTVRAYRAAGGDEEGKEKEKEKEKVGRNARKEWARAHFVNDRTLREATSIRDQLRESCRRADIDWRVSCGEREEPVLMSLAHGLAQNAALIAPDGSYKQIMGQSVRRLRFVAFSFG